MTSSRSFNDSPIIAPIAASFLDDDDDDDDNDLLQIEESLDVDTGGPVMPWPLQSPGPELGR